VQAQRKPAARKKTAPPQEAKQQQKKNVPIALIKKAIDINDDDAGWVNLGQLGNYLGKVQPDFDPRSYGFTKLTDLITSHAQHFEWEDRAKANSPTRIIYVRVKKAK
jgi:Fe-S-cluster formation regulator IscX/YfhJ